MSRLTILSPFFSVFVHPDALLRMQGRVSLQRVKAYPASIRLAVTGDNRLGGRSSHGSSPQCHTAQRAVRGPERSGCTPGCQQKCSHQGPS